MKFIMLGFMELTEPIMEYIGNIIVGPFKQNKNVELVMIMIVFPMICNACQFWIIDNILKFSPDNRELIEIPLDDLDKHDSRKFSNIIAHKDENLNDTSDNIEDMDNNVKNKDKLINKL